MKEIEVEGYLVTIQKAEGAFIVSVPELPGCTIQVRREEDAKGEIRRMIGLYLLDMAAVKPAGRLRNPEEGGGAKAKLRR